MSDMHIGDAAPLYVNEETGYEVYLVDAEDLLTEQEEEQLVSVMEPITAYGNVAFESRQVKGQSSYSYVEDHYTGYFGESGTLFLIDMGNRRIQLYSSGKIEKRITPSYADSITDNVYQYATDGDYYTCAQKVFTQEYTLLRGGRIAQPMKYISCALLALILALLINYFVVRRKSKNTKTPQEKIMEAVATAALVGSAASVVTSRERHTSSDSGGFGGGGGGGGGGFSGGGHSF